MPRWVAGVLGVLLVGALALTLLLRSGSHDHTVQPAPVLERPWNVIGVVTRAERPASYRTDAPSYVIALVPEVDLGPQGHIVFTVGPERLHLAGGRTLDVPAGTPGANGCVELLTDAEKLAATGLPPPEGLRDGAVRDYGARNLFCVVVAAVDRGGHVTRFSVLDTSSQYLFDHRLADAGGIVGRRADRYLTNSGYAFPLAPRATGDCLPRKVGLAFLRKWGSAAYVDPAHGWITAVDCIGRA